MAKYIVIKELHANTEVVKNFYIYDFLFVMVYLGLSLIFRDIVASALQIPYFIFNGFIAIKLVSRTKTNPGKHYYQALFLWYKRDSGLYKTVLNISKNTQREEMKIELEKKKEEGYWSK